MKTETKGKGTFVDDSEKAIKRHEENIEPTKKLIEGYLSKTKGYYNTTSILERFVYDTSQNWGFETNARPNVGLLKDYSHVCNNLLALLANPEISKEIDNKLQPEIGRQVLNMGKFIKALSESKVVQAELDLMYIDQFYRGKEKVAPVHEYYSRDIEVQDPDFEDSTFD